MGLPFCNQPPITTLNKDSDNEGGNEEDYAGIDCELAQLLTKKQRILPVHTNMDFIQARWRRQGVWLRCVTDVSFIDSNGWHKCVGRGEDHLWPISTCKRRYYCWDPLPFVFECRKFVKKILPLFASCPRELTEVFEELCDMVYIWFFIRMSGVYLTRY